MKPVTHLRKTECCKRQRAPPAKPTPSNDNGGDDPGGAVELELQPAPEARAQALAENALAVLRALPLSIYKSYLLYNIKY